MTRTRKDDVQQWGEEVVSHAEGMYETDFDKIFYELPYSGCPYGYDRRSYFSRAKFYLNQEKTKMSNPQDTTPPVLSPPTSVPVFMVYMESRNLDGNRVKSFYVGDDSKGKPLWSLDSGMIFVSRPRAMLIASRHKASDTKVSGHTLTL